MDVFWNTPDWAQTCPQCYRPLNSANETSEDLMASPCGHVFHEKCMQPALTFTQPNYLSIYWHCHLCKKRFLFTNCVKWHPQQDSIFGTTAPRPAQRNLPVILDCPACSNPLTSTDGNKFDLLVTPCGHIYHRICLPASHHKSQTCISCNKRFLFRNCINYYPKMAEPASTNLLPSISGTSAPHPQDTSCGLVQECPLRKNYNVLVRKSEDLDKRIKAEQEAVTRLRGVVRAKNPSNCIIS